MTVVNQSYADLTVYAGDDETINGIFDTITAGDDVTLYVNGYDDTINANYSVLIPNDAALAGNTVNGSFDTIMVPINSHLTVNGTQETINDAGHGYVTFDGAAGSVITMTGTVLEITIPAFYHLSFTGTQNNFYLGDHVVGSITGDDDNFIGSYERFTLTGSTKGGDEFVGDDDRATITGDDAQLLLYGDHEVIHCGVGTSMAVMSGSDDRFIGAGFFVLTQNAADDPASIWIGGNGATGAFDVLTGDDMSIVVGGASDVSMSGEDDTVAVRLESRMYFEGAGLNAHVGSDASLIITGDGATSALDTITGGGCSVSINTAANVELELYGANVVIGNGVDVAMERSANVVTAYISDTINILWGQSNQITVGVDDLITDGGSGTLFKVDNNVGATTINNFAADTTGVIDLLYGMAGITTAAGAAAALVSDGAGGSKLDLGIYGTLDFAGDTSLTAANFKIG